MGPSAQSASKNELATCKTLGTYGKGGKPQAAKLLQAQAGAIICARACLAQIVATTTTRSLVVIHPYVG